MSLILDVDVSLGWVEGCYPEHVHAFARMEVLRKSLQRCPPPLQALSDYSQYYHVIARGKLNRTVCAWGSMCYSMFSMDIRGNKVYLTVSEQVTSALSSPIDINGLNVCEALKQAVYDARRFEAMQVADDDELTHAERASISPGLTKALAQKAIYSQIATEQITQGQLDLEKVIDLL